ncbi:MAG: NUDIX domain-containing protein [Nanoarchaeota archaeon]|nr:NUDIX domain-containing protein [Nanoarchaeota archaeon]MBU0962386.1 NUDIX domain-containing protein [Nanoarchaeota archaeon]
MQKKILTFIICNGKILALYSKSHPKYGKAGWFVVTGSLEGKESYEEAVVREIKEETGLVVKDIFPLNFGSIYEWGKDICEEHNFISFVKPGNIILNEEHSRYKWLNMDEFIELIKWDDDKKILKNVLEMALNRRNYFKKFNIKNYMEKKDE